MIACCKTLYVVWEPYCHARFTETENAANNCLHQKALAFMYTGKKEKKEKSNKNENKCNNIQTD